MQHLLHAHLAQTIRIDVAQRMRSQSALRVVPVILARHFERELTNRLHLIGIFR